MWVCEASLEDMNQSNNNKDQDIQDTTDAIISAAEQSIPNTNVTVKPIDFPWIACHIKILIRRRKHIFQSFKKKQEQHLVTFGENIKMLETNLSKK